MNTNPNTAGGDPVSNAVFVIGAWVLLSTLFFVFYAVTSEMFWHQTWRPDVGEYPSTKSAYYIQYILFVASDFSRYFKHFLAYGDTFDIFWVKLDMLFRLLVPFSVSMYMLYRILLATFGRKSNEIIQIGAEIEKDVHSFMRQCKRKLRGATGLKFHENLRIFAERENEHILLAGATGAGKTQVLLKMLDDIQSRESDSSLIFDIKGDFTSYYLCNKNRVFLFAPWDRRSVKWDVAADIRTIEDARAFAGAFIVSNGSESNPYFSDAARDVLAGVLEFLMQTKGKEWGFADIVKILGDKNKAFKSLRYIDHAAASHLDGEGGQSQGVMGSIRAPMQSLDSISRWWDDGEKGSPLIDIMLDDNRRTHLIMAARADIQETATPLIAAFLSLLIGRGLTLPDDSKRRLWFVLDELAALPKIDRLLDLITLGRSKGLCLIAGLQDLGRLISKYGREEVQTLSSQFGMQMIGRLGDVESAEWAAGIFGQTRVERQQLSENFSQQDGLGNAALSGTWQQTDKSALLDSDFLQLKKATKKDPAFHFFAKLTDSYGDTFAGKLEYFYQPKSKVCEAVLLKEIDRLGDADAYSGSGSGSGSGEVEVDKTDLDKSNEKEKSQAKKEEKQTEKQTDQTEQHFERVEVAQDDAQEQDDAQDDVAKEIIVESAESAGAKSVMELLQLADEMEAIDDDIDDAVTASSISAGSKKKKSKGHSM